MRSFLLLIFAAGLVQAQAVDGIHAPASRQVMLPVEEAQFQVSVSAALDTTVQQVKRLMQDAGAPDATVVLLAIGPGSDSRVGSSVSTLSAPTLPPVSIFSATFTVPVGAAVTVAKAIVDLRSQLAAPFTSLSFNVTYGASAAAVEAARLSMLPKLVEEARKSAQSLAAAAGVKLGAIRGVNEGGGGVYAYVGSPAFAVRTGDFSLVSSLSPVAGIIAALPPNTSYTFSLELVFATAP